MNAKTRARILAVVLPLTCMAFGLPLTAADNATYTSNSNFSAGTLFNVNHDTPDTLRLNTTLTTFAVMWIANAGEDSISKIDTNTGQELARYKTGLNRGLHEPWSWEAPSRTAVDRDGNVYVANRNFNGNMPPAVVKILSSGGIDRNNNGTIETSTGSTPILHVDSNGNGRLDTAELKDERIAWIAYVGPANSLGRSLTLDQNGFIWLGASGHGYYYKLDPVTGSVLAGPYPTGSYLYGAVVDSNGILWGATLNNTLLRFNTNTGAATVFTSPYGTVYGIAIGNGKVYMGGSGCDPIVFNPANNTFSRLTPSNCVYSLGIAVDGGGNIYTRNNGNGVRKISPSGTILWDKPMQPGFNAPDFRGLAVDAKNDVWFIAVSSTRNLEKYRGSDGAPLGVFSAGYKPYTYTDVTGAGSFSNTARSGKWTVTQDGGAAATHWGKVDWNLEAEGSVPAGASIVVKARAADTVAGLDSKNFVTMPKGAFLPAGAELVGRYVQVEVTLTANSSNDSPVLSDITIQASPDTEPPVVVAPANVAYECATEVTAPAPSAATVTDNRGIASVQVSSANNGGAGTAASPLIITRTWTATDTSGLTASASQTVTVADLTAPAITLNAGTSSVECHTSYSDPGATASDNCPGNVTITVSGSVDAGTPGTYTLIYTAKDAAGNTSTVDRTVTVVDTTAPQIRLEGGDMTVECHGPFTDPGAKVSDSCAGDISTALRVSGSVDVDTPGTYTLTYNASDPAGNAAAPVTRTVVVADTTAPEPSVAALPDVVGECSATVTTAPVASDACAGTITGSTSDPLSYTAQGSYTVTWTFVDPAGNKSIQTQRVVVKDTKAPVPDAAALPDVVGECSATIPSAPNASDECSGAIGGKTSDPVSYTTQGTYTVTWTFTDAAGNASTQTQRVIVRDTQPPSATAPAAVSTQTTECALPMPDFTTNLNASDNCTAAGALVIQQSPAPGTSSPLGTTPVTITIIDAVGNATRITTSFTVTNAPPSVSAGGPYTVSEGGSVKLTAAATDAGGPVALAWDLDNDGTFESAGAEVTFSAAGMDGPSSRTVRVLATDRCGQTSMAMTTVQVTNVAPAVTITQPALWSGRAKGTAVTVLAPFTDAGTPDTHTCSINWDNAADVVGNVAAGTVSQGAGSGTCTATYTFHQPGIYTAQVTVTDDDGGSNSASIVIAVFDPDAGKVTGGVWFNATAGMAPGSAAAGKVNIEFNPQMLKGEVKGDTKFLFAAAGIDFRSVKTDWMVVSRPRAQWHGYGTIGGTGNYEFLVIVHDGKAAGDNTDRVRIRIWDPSRANGLVFDSAPGSSGDLDTATMPAMVGGSVTVHK